MRSPGARVPTLIGAIATATILAATILVAAGPADAAGRQFDWPLKPRPAVQTPFDPPEQDWLPGHRGIDLSGSTGQSVVAAGAGTVVFAGVVAGRPVMSIDHAGGLRTTYEPVQATVARGQTVRRGDAIGILVGGHEQCASTCLHWGVRRGSVYLDPAALVASTPVRLKPVDAASQ